MATWTTHLLDLAQTLSLLLQEIHPLFLRRKHLLWRNVASRCDGHGQHTIACLSKMQMFVGAKTKTNTRLPCA
jgi:hypothetical protein